MIGHRLVVTDDGSAILVTVYQNGDPEPLVAVELTVEWAVALAGGLISAVSSHLAARAEYRRE